MFERLLCLLGFHDISNEKQSAYEFFTVYPCRRLGCIHAEIRRNPEYRPTSWREIG